MRALSDVLGFSFRDPALLELALTHRSVSAENFDRSDNERMEFLGDAVLQLVVTDRLYADYPELPEGQMAKVRAAVVSGSTLSEAAARSISGPTSSCRRPRNAPVAGRRIRSSPMPSKR